MIMSQQIPPIPPPPDLPVIVDTGILPPWVTLPPGITALIAVAFLAAALHECQFVSGGRSGGSRSRDQSPAVEFPRSLFRQF